MWATGEKNVAVEHLKKAVNLQPSNGIIVAQLIEYFFESGHVREAEVVMEQFHTQSNKTNPALPYIKSAQLLLNDNKPDLAKKILEKMPFPLNINEKREQAIIYKKSKEYEKAHVLFKEIYPQFMEDPYIIYDFASTKLSLAREKNKQNRYKLQKDVSQRLAKEAVELLQRGLQLFEECNQKGWCWFELARALAFLKEPKSEIERAYLQALSICPNEKVFQYSYDNWKNQQEIKYKNKKR